MTALNDYDTDRDLGLLFLALESDRALAAVEEGFRDADYLDGFANALIDIAAVLKRGALPEDTDADLFLQEANEYDVRALGEDDSEIVLPLSVEMREFLLGEVAERLDRLGMRAERVLICHDWKDAVSA